MIDNNEIISQQKPLSFHDLMKFRVREILIVSTEYDGFVLEEDGRLAERIYNEYYDLSIYYVPRIKRVIRVEDAYSALRKRNYDMVIVMSHIGETNVFDFCDKVKAGHPSLPIVMLSYERLTPEIIKQVRENPSIDRVFHWSGESNILLAVIKYVEDKKNLDDDCSQGIQVILVVEDSPAYYSQFLSIIYAELMKQTRYLVVHAENTANKLLRVRARPKIILAETYEEAVDAINKHKENLLGVITDVRFPKDGDMYSEAGIELIKLIKKTIPDIPVLMQSEEEQNREKAEKLKISFLDKNSPNLLYDIRKSVLDEYGFGEFVFRYANGEVLGKAIDIEEFIYQVKTIPSASLYYHGLHNHFSRWFRARTAFEIANELRKIDIRNYTDLEELREIILYKIQSYLKNYRSGEILEFDSTKLGIENAFLKIGSGSLGGKARGIAFLNHIIKQNSIQNKYENIQVLIPLTFVICADAFDDFVEANNLYEFAMGTNDEDAIAQRFLQADLPEKIKNDLRKLAEKINSPLAVRSSSILEDSQTLPFAGIYNTYIIPNNDPDIEIRLKHICDSVRLVYSSVFYNSPKQYAKNADLRIEEEKMAVIIQELVGQQHENYFYPLISGVAQSYNFYPYSNIQPKDGTVSIALGFGRLIAEGGKVYRYSPTYPKKPPPYSGPREFIEKLQSSFYALDLEKTKDIYVNNEDMKDRRMIKESSCYATLPVSELEASNSFRYVASTYSPENDRIIDNVNFEGPKVITFAPILKQHQVNLNKVIIDMLALGKRAFGCDVEIEFAVNFPEDDSKPKQFYFLQVRPMVVGSESVQTKISEEEKQNAYARSAHTIGNGVYNGIYDMIYVDPEKFDIKETENIAKEIEYLNKLLFDEGRKCILSGFGRVGTYDRWLGIPLTWAQMSQAMVVVENDIVNLQAEPSLGSHFYHNLTSLRMGYFHINAMKTSNEYVDWDRLRSERAYKETEHVKLIRSDNPFIVKIDAGTSEGIIYKEKQKR
ncbi:MAG: phosphoenolpyruvate synthase [Clostridia bacterium]|nr:phosphoenolpyruvate synthase [Clostridia bacterium]